MWFTVTFDLFRRDTRNITGSLKYGIGSFSVHQVTKKFTA